MPPPEATRRHPSLGETRYAVVLYMKLCGATNAEVSERLGRRLAWVQRLVSNPGFKERLGRELARLRRATFEELLQAVRAQAVPNFEKLVSLRESAEDERTQLGAARAIALECDRLWPRRAEPQDERTLRVTLDREAVERITGVLRELGRPVLELEATAVPVEAEDS